MKIKKLFIGLTILSLGTPTFAQLLPNNITPIDGVMTLDIAPENTTPDLTINVTPTPILPTSVDIPTNILTSKDLITQNENIFISLDFLRKNFGMELQLIDEGQILILPTVLSPLIPFDQMEVHSMNLDIKIPEDAIKIDRATIKTIDTELKQITILPAGKDDNLDNYIILNISDLTSFANGTSQFENMHEGMIVEVYHSSSMTKSRVPQTAAYIINPRIDGTVMLPDPNHVIPAPIVYEYDQNGKLISKSTTKSSPTLINQPTTIIPENAVKIDRATIKTVDTELKQITILPVGKDDNIDNYIVLNISDLTSFANGISQFENMHEGMIVEVYHSPSMTRSRVPQAAAYAINPQADSTINQETADFIVAEIMPARESVKITEVLENNNNISIRIGETRNQEEIFHITPDTLITKNNKTVPATELKAGQIVTITYGPTMTMSLPPQMQAVTIAIISN